MADFRLLQWSRRLWPFLGQMNVEDKPLNVCEEQRASLLTEYFDNLRLLDFVSAAPLRFGV